MKEMESQNGTRLADSQDDLELNFGNNDDLLSATNFCWSPNGRFFAVSIKHRIIIRDGRKLSLHQTYSLSDGVKKIDALKWSSDSLYLAAICSSRGLVCIRRVEDINWKCRIDLGDEKKGVGLVDFCWSPDARHILTTSAFYTQLTVWSLSRSVVTSIRNICPIPNYKSFSSEGKYLAVAHFDSDFKTRLCIYESSDWSIKETFAVATKDLIGMDWCPNDSTILLWDSPLFCNLYIYSPTGEMLKHYSPDGLSVGIRSVRWSPAGHLLALTNHRNTFRILNGLTFGLLLEEELELSITQQSIHKDCILYREILTETDGLLQHQYEVDKNWSWDSSGGCSCPPGNNAISDLNSIQFSPDGNYVACSSVGNPNRLWIWNLETVTLSTILVNLKPITDFQWDTNPNHTRLTLCSGGLCIYFWTRSKSYIKNISSLTSNDNTLDFKADRISWNPQGISFSVQNLASGRTIIGFIKSP